MPEARTQNYHHGGVRERLIEAAIDALRTEPLENISMRKLAKTIGVSHNAPYMHFADREALWQTVSGQGFELMRAQIESALKPVSHWKERLIVGSEAYVRFAMENRQHMVVMFRNSTPGVDRTLSPEAGEALQLLAREVGAAVAAGKLMEERPERLTMLIWIALHGLTMAQIQLGELGGPLHASPLERRVEWMIDNLLHGIGS